MGRWGREGGRGRERHVSPRVKCISMVCQFVPTSIKRNPTPTSAASHAVVVVLRRQRRHAHAAPVKVLLLRRRRVARRRWGHVNGERGQKLPPHVRHGARHHFAVHTPVAILCCPADQLFLLGLVRTQRGREEREGRSEILGFMQSVQLSRGIWAVCSCA